MPTETLGDTVKGLIRSDLCWPMLGSYDRSVTTPTTCSPAVDLTPAPIFEDRAVLFSKTGSPVLLFLVQVLLPCVFSSKILNSKCIYWVSISIINKYKIKKFKCI